MSTKNASLKWVEDHAADLQRDYAAECPLARNVLRANALYLAYPTDSAARKSLEAAIEQYQGATGEGEGGS